MKIEEIQLTELKPYSLNAKKHPESQIKGLAESIKRFGFTQPIVIDKDNEIIIGHGRLEGARIAGLETVPCLMMDNLTEAEVKGLRLIDNRISETGWDQDILTVDLDGLNFDFADFNIDFDFIGDHLMDFEPGDESDQSQLDQKKLTICPNCGEKFDHAKNQE